MNIWTSHACVTYFETFISMETDDGTLKSTLNVHEIVVICY